MHKQWQCKQASSTEQLIKQEKYHAVGDCA